MLYAVTVQVCRRNEQWDQARSLPTFFLDECVQGILSEEGAIAIVTKIVNPFGDLGVSACAVRVHAEGLSGRVTR